MQEDYFFFIKLSSGIGMCFFKSTISSICIHITTSSGLISCRDFLLLNRENGKNFFIGCAAVTAAAKEIFNSDLLSRPGFIIMKNLFSSSSNGQHFLHHWLRFTCERLTFEFFIKATSKNSKIFIYQLFSKKYVHIYRAVTILFRQFKASCNTDHT